MSKTYEISKFGDIQAVVYANFPVPHGSSTRDGGVSSGPYASLSLSTSTGDRLEHVEENRRRLGRALGLEVQPRLKMNHGVRVVRLGASNLRDPLPEADACVTCEPEVSLCITTADCVPLLFYSPERGAVGAAHAGWRGTVNGIARETVWALQAHFDCPLESLQVAIGPCIGPCCFEVGSEVAAEFNPQFSELVIPRPEVSGKFHIDLRRANQLWLERAGVPAANIATCDLCTVCHGELFFSHRRDHGQTGRMMSVIQTRR